MNNDDSKLASLCKGGCGFYGSAIFNNMCSKCYKDSQMAKNSENDKSQADSKDASITAHSSSPASNPQLTQSTATSTANITAKASTITMDITAASSRLTRKHRRSPSPVPEKKLPAAAVATSSISVTGTAAAPSTSQTSMVAAVAAAAAAATASSRVVGSSATATTSAGNEHQRPPQVNKGKCYQCRAKVPLVKQTTNKCRCQYIFCDSHRYPDRHDCFIDFGELDRAELAKNNPKLHERPTGGRSFRRIDSI